MSNDNQKIVTSSDMHAGSFIQAAQSIQKYIISNHLERVTLKKVPPCNKRVSLLIIFELLFRKCDCFFHG
jgi:hypothetical protein